MRKWIFYHFKKDGRLPANRNRSRVNALAARQEGLSHGSEIGIISREWDRNWIIPRSGKDLSIMCDPVAAHKYPWVTVFPFSLEIPVTDMVATNKRFAKALYIECSVDPITCNLRTTLDRLDPTRGNKPLELNTFWYWLPWQYLTNETAAI